MAAGMVGASHSTQQMRVVVYTIPQKFLRNTPTGRQGSAEIIFTAVPFLLEGMVSEYAVKHSGFASLLYYLGIEPIRLEQQGATSVVYVFDDYEGSGIRETEHDFFSDEGISVSNACEFHKAVMAINRMRREFQNQNGMQVRGRR